jgi:hypothetical protein
MEANDYTSPKLGLGGNLNLSLIIPSQEISFL